MSSAVSSVLVSVGAAVACLLGRSTSIAISWSGFVLASTSAAEALSATVTPLMAVMMSPTCNPVSPDLALAKLAGVPGATKFTRTPSISSAERNAK